MRCSKPKVCEKLDDCRCYAYIANTDKHVCGKLVDGYIFPCKNPACCPGGCPTPKGEPVGYGDSLPNGLDLELDTASMFLLCVIVTSLIVTSLKM